MIIFTSCNWKNTLGDIKYANLYFDSISLCKSIFFLFQSCASHNPYTLFFLRQFITLNNIIPLTEKLFLAHNTPILGGRFPYPLTFPNIGLNNKGGDFTGIYPVITPGVCLLRAPRVMNFTLKFSEG